MINAASVIPKMELMLLRHAEAAPAGPKDELRPLTDAGRRDAELVGRGLDRLDLVPELVLFSPLLRAKQTAEAVTGGFKGQRPGMEERTGLGPGATPAEIMKLLQGAPGRRRVLLVGHQPDLGRLLSFVVSGGSMELEFALRPGTVCVTEIDSIPLRSPGRLVLFAPPSTFAGVVNLG